MSKRMPGNIFDADQGHSVVHWLTIANMIQDE